MTDTWDSSTRTLDERQSRRPGHKPQATPHREA
jgi:hypothetical protein